MSPVQFLTRRTARSWKNSCEMNPPPATAFPTATGVKLLTVVQGSSSSRIFDEFRTGGNLSATTTMRTYAGNFSSSSIFTMGVIAQAIEYQGNDAGNALEVRVVGYVHPV